MTGHGGTARARGIGGAIVALGGDISSASVNPAGFIIVDQLTIPISTAVVST
jgi:hypothetical protein